MQTPSVRNAGRTRPQMVDIDLLPQVYPQRIQVHFDPQWVWWIGAFALLMLAVPQFTAGVEARQQLAAVEELVADAQVRSELRIVPPEVRQLQAELAATTAQIEAIERSRQALRATVWPWAHVLQLISDLTPAGAQLEMIEQGQSPDILTLQGTAEVEVLALAFASRLRNSGLVTDASVQNVSAKLVSLPPVIIAPKPVTVIPGLDYVVSSQSGAVAAGGGLNVIKGIVVDDSGPVEGLSFRISSCCPRWSAVYPTRVDRPEPGTFQFLVGPGDFTVEILNALPGKAQAATALKTTEATTDTHFEWLIVFKKQTAAPLNPLTPTPTFVPVPVGTATIGSPNATPTSRTAGTPSAGLPGSPPIAIATPAPQVIEGPTKQVYNFVIRAVLKPVVEVR